ncbi:MAG: alpha-glucan family phosphorylase, partial [Planctomycetaceae bacterium]|nr:alpha-glucan family phosphorylase [Planctomycetaceae bacterium]
DPNALTLGFARRFTEYKRPTLLLQDPDRLRKILLNPDRPVQLIVAGKAHPNDQYGKSMVRRMNEFAAQPAIRTRIVFLEDYDIALAQHLAGGVDVWLNTPRRPAEACGTSGMKTLFNGGLNVSVRDGWWDEAWTAETGWQIGNADETDPAIRDPREAAELMDLLEHQVIPEFYDRNSQGIPTRWLQRVRASMFQLTPHFTSDRMVREYVEQAYAPAASSFARRKADNCRLAKDLYRWHVDLEDHWHELHFGDLQIEGEGGRQTFSIALYLGELDADAVEVQLYAESTSGQAPTVIPMRREQALTGAINGFRFTAPLPNDRPAADFTARVIPHHPEGLVPLEESWIMWQR